jgi:hypothetical protein
VPDTFARDRAALCVTAPAGTGVLIGFLIAGPIVFLLLGAPLG